MTEDENDPSFKERNHVLKERDLALQKERDLALKERNFAPNPPLKGTSP